MVFSFREAVSSDVAELAQLIERSVRELQVGDYSTAEREGALARVYGVDSRLIEDGTYFVVEVEGGTMVACGGWSKRRTLFGGDEAAGREDTWLDPETDAAKIRAFFVHPDWARRGLGSSLLALCEERAQTAGFRRFEMGATVTGEKLYAQRGYVAVERLAVPLGDQETLTVIRMVKEE
jgi:GNAT superfamily N-acetyltransferase